VRCFRAQERGRRTRIGPGWIWVTEGLWQRTGELVAYQQNKIGPVHNGDARAEAHQGQPKRPATGGSDGITQVSRAHQDDHTEQQRVTHSVGSGCQGKRRWRGHTGAGYAASIRRRTCVPGATRERRLMGGSCTPGRVLPFWGGARAGDWCNRNSAGQVGAWTVKCWWGGELLAFSSAGGWGGTWRGREEEMWGRGER
jgi:hypothetical protein